MGKGNKVYRHRRTPTRRSAIPDAPQKVGNKRPRDTTTDILSPPPQPPKKKRKPGKTGRLNALGRNNPGVPPMQLLAENHSTDNDVLLRKTDPSQRGEHTPSAVNYNKLRKPFLHVSGRPHSARTAGKTDYSIPEEKIPTFQFRDRQGNPTMPDFGPAKTVGKRAHSITTTLRQLAGVGEGDSLFDRDDLLDTTLSAYRHGDYEKGVHMMDDPMNPTPMKVDMFNKNKKQRLVRHKVSPYVGQAIFNIWARTRYPTDPDFEHSDTHSGESRDSNGAKHHFKKIGNT